MQRLVTRSALAAVVLILGGCSGAKDAAPKKRPPPLVTVAPAQVRDVPVTLSYTVDIRPIEQSDIQSKVAGYVEKIFVDRGDAVKKGQLLAEVRPSELPEQVQQAREQMGQTDASLKLAEENVRRARELFKREMISRAELDQSEAQLSMAQSARGGARSGLGAVTTRLAETHMTAPFSGWVAKRYLDPGAMVQPGPNNMNILTLMRTDQVRVFVSVLEADAPKVRRGLPVQITVDALTGRSFLGTVTRVPPSLDVNTRTLEVEIVIPNSDGALKPGMYGRAVLTIDNHPGAVVLPVEAVIAEEKDRFCYLVDSPKPSGDGDGDGKGPPVGKARRVKVETGFDGGDWLEITKGLAGGEPVIVMGVDLASDGAPVSVAHAQPPVQGRAPAKRD